MGVKYKDHIREELRSRYPRIDLTNFDEIYKVIIENYHIIMKRESRICYNKKCDRRMY